MIARNRFVGQPTVGVILTLIDGIVLFACAPIVLVVAEVVVPTGSLGSPLRMLTDTRARFRRGRPGGRIWLLKSVPGFKSLEPMLADLARTADAAGLMITATTEFVTRRRPSSRLLSPPLNSVARLIDPHMIRFVAAEGSDAGS